MSARILKLHRATVVDDIDTVIIDNEPPLLPYNCVVVTGDGQRLNFTTLAESLGAAELNALSSAHPHGVRFLDVKPIPVLQLVDVVPDGNAMDAYRAEQLDRRVQLAALIPASAVGLVLAVAVAVVSALVMSGARAS
jgi:hypothetical protein